MTKKSPATAKKAQRRDVPRVALDMDEIGASLGVSTPSIYLLAERGLLRTFVIGRRRLATIEAVQACARANGARDLDLGVDRTPQAGRRRHQGIDQ